MSPIKTFISTALSTTILRIDCCSYQYTLKANARELPQDDYRTAQPSHP